MAEASKPQKKRRPKPTPEPAYDEDSYDYDDDEYESYDAIEEYQPSPRRSSRKKKRSSSKSSGLSIPWKKIGSILGTVLVVLFIAGRIVRVIGRVDQAIGGGQAAVDDAVVTESQALAEYVSVDGGFRVKMPTTVVENHTPFPNSTEKLWRWGATGNQCIFDINKKTTRIGLPGEVQMVKNMYDPAAPGYIAAFGIKGDLTSETTVTLGGHEAVELEFAISEPDQSFLCVRLAVVGSDVWQASVSASGPVSPEIKSEFFNSFQFLSAPAETVESQAAATSPNPKKQQMAASSFDS
ncbi:MAG: hypothetical protein O2945_19990 [Planctomycetota bacterium]|nr:hypothetical protein [Planctomycetota bacterium]MDA0921357.1 hypothetical protein [Planctomycetota bacterium]